MLMRVLKVTNPGEISIREISATKEFTDFDRLNHELVSVLDTDSYIQHTLFEITIGKVCGIKIPEALQMRIVAVYDLQSYQFCQ